MHWVGAACLAVGVAGLVHAQGASKKLVVYCPHPLVFIEPLVKKFEATTGIQTEVVAAGGRANCSSVSRPRRPIRWAT